MSPRRCSPTTACACCCATSSASPPARPCKASTGVCWARGLRRRPWNLLRLRKEVRTRDLPDQIRMVLPQVLLGVLPELLVVLAPDGVATHARDLLHRPIVLAGRTRARSSCCSEGDAPALPRASQCRSTWMRKLFALPLSRVRASQTA